VSRERVPKGTKTEGVPDKICKRGETTKKNLISILRGKGGDAVSIGRSS